LYKFKLVVARSLVQGTINPQPVQRVEVQKEVGSARHVQDDIRLDAVGHLPRRMADIPKRMAATQHGQKFATRYIAQHTKTRIRQMRTIYN
jgi:hypothetical protein